MVRATWAIAFALAGCSPKESGGSTDTGSNASTSGSSSGTSADACAPFPAIDCRGPRLCDGPADISAPDCGPSEFPINSNHHCVIRAFRESIAGVTFVDLIHAEGMDEASCGYFDEILILGDGTAIVSRSGPGGSPTIINQRRVEIQPPEFFDACLDSDDVEAVQACLFDWFVPDSCVPGVCCPTPTEAGHPLCE